LFGNIIIDFFTTKQYICQIFFHIFSYQAEHARAHPEADFEFKIIDRGSTSGKFPTSLDRKEQQALDRLGGPTNKSNPNGGASNKKNVINK
jgi:hypothetical protein